MSATTPTRTKSCRPMGRQPAHLLSGHQERQVFALVNNVFNQKFALFGTYFEPQGTAKAGLPIVLTDQRTEVARPAFRGLCGYLGEALGIYSPAMHKRISRPKKAAQTASSSVQYDDAANKNERKILLSGESLRPDGAVRHRAAGRRAQPQPISRCCRAICRRGACS